MAGGVCGTVTPSRGSRPRRKPPRSGARSTFIPWAIGRTMPVSSASSLTTPTRTIQALTTTRAQF